MAAIVLRDIHKGFSGVPVLTGVSGSVGQRDRIGLVGRNGEGKTTLLRLMSGEITPDEGDVERARESDLSRHEKPAERAGRGPADHDIHLALRAERKIP